MKKLLVTGASSGIGHSLVKHFAGRFEVIALARRKDTMDREFEGLAGVSTYAADLSNLASLEEVLDRIRADHGPVLNLVSNAGIMHRASVDSLAATDLDYSFTLNALAPLTILRRFLPDMREAGFGRVIHVTSGAPLNCGENFGAYSASKAALNALTVTAAKENTKWDIKINLMSPGPCKTEMAPNGTLPPSACHPTADYLMNLPADGPTGRFFWLGRELPLFPDLSGVNWMEGTASENFARIFPEGR